MLSPPSDHELLRSYADGDVRAFERLYERYEQVYGFCLRRLLARLTDGQREALLLSKYQGFTYWEVAEITGNTEAAGGGLTGGFARGMRRAAGTGA